MKKSMSELIKIRDKLKEEGKVIPATFDAMFKEVMKGCPNYLADILYQVTGLNKEMILKHMEIQDTEHGISHILEKRKRSDVIIKVKNNVLNLEMNIEFYKGLYEKNEAYLRRVGSEMIKIGQDYKYKKPIQISFDNFAPFGKKYDDLIMEFRIMDTKHHIVEVENYVKYHINLAKICKKYYNREQRDTLTKLEKELLILVLDEISEIKEISKGDSELMEAGKKIEDMSFDINMIGLYDEEEDRKITDYLKTQYKLELAEEEGLKRGMKKGIEKGIETGKKQSKIEIAKKLKESDVGFEIIVKTTGLTKEEIKKL